MARVSRNKPTSTGPGSGSPRSRTAARPGERAASQRTRTRPVDPRAAEAEPSSAASPPRVAVASRALGLTWRLLLLGVVVAVIAVTLAQSLRVYFVQADQINALRAEIEAKQEEIATLEDQLERWDDPAFVEAQARERLGWVFPGEVGYRVIGPDGEPLGGDSDVLAADETAAPPGLWWEKMWGSVAVADQPAPEPEPEPSGPSDDVTIGASPQPSPSTTEE